MEQHAQSGDGRPSCDGHADVKSQGDESKVAFLIDHVPHVEANGKTTNEHDTKMMSMIINDDDESPGIAFVTEKPRAFVYKVSENPPIIWTILFGLQQCLVNIGNPLLTTLVVSEVACFQEDTSLKLQVLSATFLMAGLATLTMCTLGVRLPIYQGATPSFLVPLLALGSIGIWGCPESTFTAMDPQTNVTILMADMGNGTIRPYRDQALEKIAMLSGSLCVAGTLQFLVGISGAVGILVRFIGPITIVPTITLLGLELYIPVAKFCEPDWMMAMFSLLVNLVLCFYLAKCNTPIPMWNRQKGFYIHWYPFHQVLSIFITMVILYIVATILTHSGFYTDDPTDVRFMARTDAKGSVVAESDWFSIPYPGQFGSVSFETGVFINFLLATIVTMFDSIGDYAACARVAKVTPPPPFAFNRGLAVEGLMTVIGGFTGCCHATVSCGENIGAIDITKVASLRVFQAIGVLCVLLGVFTKFGALVITVPYPLIGGLSIISLGVFIGVLLSSLQTVDLNSSRNLGIIGSTLLLGLVVPHWVRNNPDAIDTGILDLDIVIKMVLTNPAFVGGVYSCFLDNTIPATRSERGLDSQENDLHGQVSKSTDYEDGPEVYRLPFLPRSFRKSKLARAVPLFDVSEDAFKE